MDKSKDCPHCGKCPNCGRGESEFALNPYTWTGTTTTTEDTTSVQENPR